MILFWTSSFSITVYKRICTQIATYVENNAIETWFYQWMLSKFLRSEKLNSKVFYIVLSVQNVWSHKRMIQIILEKEKKTSVFVNPQVWDLFMLMKQPLNTIIIIVIT